MANFTFISFYFILFFSFAFLPLDQIRRHQFNDLRATTGPVKRVKFNGGATESVCKVTHNLTATFPMPKWFKSKWICESFLKNCWPLVPLSLIHHFRLFCLLCLKKQTKEKDFFFFASSSSSSSFLIHLTTAATSRNSLWSMSPFLIVNCDVCLCSCSSTSRNVRKQIGCCIMIHQLWALP